MITLSRVIITVALVSVVTLSENADQSLTDSVKLDSGTILSTVETTTVFGVQCGKCDVERCPKVPSCVAGLVPDACDCCQVCGARDGDRCAHEAVLESALRFPTCGTMMECRLRHDLETFDPPEGICVCTRAEKLCGSNGVTYPNECQFNAAKFDSEDGMELQLAHRGACPQVPTIITGPINVSNFTGGHVAIMCEAKGHPVPEVTWWWKPEGSDAEQPLGVENPPRLNVITRGIPDTDEIVSWLQLTSLRLTDAGEYICVVSNTEGKQTASANLTVFVAVLRWDNVAGRSEKNVSADAALTSSTRAKTTPAETSSKSKQTSTKDAAEEAFLQADESTSRNVKTTSQRRTPSTTTTTTAAETSFSSRLSPSVVVDVSIAFLAIIYYVYDVSPSVLFPRLFWAFNGR